MVSSAITITPVPSPTPYLVEMVSGGTPWWADSAQSIALLIAGALISGVSAWFAERRKTQRADEQRWDNEIIKLAGVLLEATESAYHHNYRLQAEINRNTRDGAVSVSRTPELVAIGTDTTAAIERFTSTQISLALIAPAKVATTVMHIGKEFAKVRAETEFKALPPRHPDVDLMTSLTVAVREVVGVPWRTRRNVSQD